MLVTCMLKLLFEQKYRVIANLKTQNTTLCGGSLGSRVDEERSKLRELM